MSSFDFDLAKTRPCSLEFLLLNKKRDIKSSEVYERRFNIEHLALARSDTVDIILAMFYKTL